MNRQILDFVPVDGGQEGFEIIILWPFSVALRCNQRCAAGNGNMALGSGYA
jgi:hypothetical protein